MGPNVHHRACTQGPLRGLTLSARLKPSLLAGQPARGSAERGAAKAARGREGGARGRGRFQVSAQTSAYPAGCVTIRKGSRAGEGGSEAPLEVPVLLPKARARSSHSRSMRLGCVPPCIPPASPWGAVPPRAPAPHRVPGRGRRLTQRERGTAPTRFSVLGPYGEARRSWPGLGATRSPAGLTAP